MSLVAFHRFLISAGIVFCFGYAVWEVQGWLDSRDAGALIVAMGFALLGAGLVVYLRRLNRILGLEPPDTEGDE